MTVLWGHPAARAHPCLAQPPVSQREEAEGQGGNGLPTGRRGRWQSWVSSGLKSRSGTLPRWWEGLAPAGFQGMIPLPPRPTFS